jgi:hypothetical protein
MPETGNTSEMARKLAVDMFGVFGWRDAGAHDQDWECVTRAHGPKGKTHPSDVVFQYDDPYESKRIYVNTDLKSYAKGTITYTGETIDEFKYLIDYVFRYELLREVSAKVQIRMPFADNNAASNFFKAKENYAEDFWGYEEFGKVEFTKRLDSITFSPLGQIVNSFSNVAIGMERQNAKI